MSEDFNVLKDILAEFDREAREIEAKEDFNLRCIREAEAYINGMLDSETDDFKVFSPRKAEIIHKEELEEARAKISACKEKNNALSQRRELLKGYREKVKNIWKRLEDESSLQTKGEEAEELRKDSVKRLEDLAQKIDSAVSCMEKKPVQAKQDLLIAGKNLKEIADKMRDTVWLANPGEE